MRKIYILLLMMVAVGESRATTREFTVKNSEDGKSIIQVFLPAPDKATGRMVIACPGGGYGWLSVKNEGTDWADFFLQQGIAYAVLHYRFPNGDRTLPMTDAMQAIRIVRDSAKLWRVNPNDVGIMGFSAGGHLASTIATHAPLDACPNFQILFYPVVSMMEGLGHHGSWKNFLGEERNNLAMQKLFSSDQQVKKHQTPPAILLMANDDQTVPVLTNGLSYYQALRREGIPATIYIYPSGGHGFGFQHDFLYHEQMKKDLTDWLQNLDNGMSRTTADGHTGFCGIFRLWGFIGDSLCSGEHEYHKADGTKGYADLYDYSWGQYICRAIGAQGENYSQGGETARGWIEHFWNHPKNNNHNIDAKVSPKQAYIMALGVNDCNRKHPVGDIKTDIDTVDFLNNADTYAGNYAGIIQRVKSIQPDAKIFVVTNPDYQGEERQPYNAVVRAMADIFSNVYVIDIDKFGPSYAKGTDFRERYFTGGHLNAMGYQQTAWMLMAYIDRIIRQHPEAFSQVAFIGTDYKY